MSYKQDAQSLILQFQKLKIELGRIPTSAEFSGSFVGSRDSLRKNFGTYEKLVVAAGFNNLELTVDEINNREKLDRQFKKICSTRTHIQGFHIEELSLPELFQRAGNPEVLKMIGQPDTHLKFVDVAAYHCFKKFMKWYKPDVDMIFGDYLDCEGISHWPSEDLEPRRLVPEIALGRKDLAHRNSLTPATSTRVYLEGNHCAWIQRSFSQMPQFFDGIENLGYDFSLRGLLNLDSLGYNLYPLNTLVKIGNAHFTHGMFTGNNHAKKHMSTFKANIYYGHLHDNQTYNETSIYGNLEAASIGCLARLDAKFLKGRANNWVHGFGIWEFFPSGEFTRVFVPIFGGRCSYSGIVFDGNIP
jgi:hypothetical protein